MTASVQYRTPRDLTRVNLDEDYEFQYWVVHFGCTEQQLRDAVAQNGDSVEAIGRVLKRTPEATKMEWDV